MRGGVAQLLRAAALRTAGQPLQGTDGPDVIVTDGATRLDAAAGNDLICVTGPRPAAGDYLPLGSDTEPDIIRVTTGDATTYSGADGRRSTYDGGRGRDELVLAVASTHAVDADLDDGRDFVRLNGELTEWDNPSCVAERTTSCEVRR